MEPFMLEGEEITPIFRWLLVMERYIHTKTFKQLGVDQKYADVNGSRQAAQLEYILTNISPSLVHRVQPFITRETTPAGLLDLVKTRIGPAASWLQAREQGRVSVVEDLVTKAKGSHARDLIECFREILHVFSEALVLYTYENLVGDSSSTPVGAATCHQYARPLLLGALEVDRQRGHSDQMILAHRERQRTAAAYRTAAPPVTPVSPVGPIQSATAADLRNVLLAKQAEADRLAEEARRDGPGSGIHPSRLDPNNPGVGFHPRNLGAGFAPADSGAGLLRSGTVLPNPGLGREPGIADRDRNNKPEGPYRWSEMDKRWRMRTEYDVHDKQGTAVDYQDGFQWSQLHGQWLPDEPEDWIYDRHVRVWIPKPGRISDEMLVENIHQGAALRGYSAHDVLAPMLKKGNLRQKVLRLSRRHPKQFGEALDDYDYVWRDFGSRVLSGMPKAAFKAVIREGTHAQAMAFLDECYEHKYLWNNNTTDSRGGGRSYQRQKGPYGYQQRDSRAPREEMDGHRSRSRSRGRDGYFDRVSDGTRNATQSDQGRA
jgi:hypothetical protein